MLTLILSSQNKIKIRKKIKIVKSIIFNSDISSLWRNYNTCNKKLLAIFKAFKIWYYYFKNLAFSIDIVIDYKNLKYFSITKILTYRQV